MVEIRQDDPRGAHVAPLLAQHVAERHGNVPPGFAVARDAHGLSAAIAIHAHAGFVDAGAFADYAPSPHNRFMTLDPTQETRCPSSSSSATASRPGT